MCVASRRYLVNFLFPPRLSSPLLSDHAPPPTLPPSIPTTPRSILPPSIGERELRQFAVKVTGQFTNYRPVNSRANEDYRRNERRRVSRTETTSTTTITAITATTTTTTTTAMTMTLRRFPGEHRRARVPRLSLPLENSTLVTVAPEDRATLCNASRA